MVKETAPKFQEDIIDDVLRRVIEMAPQFSAAMAKQIAREVRQDWAGEAARVCYIAKRNDELLSARNAAIRRDYLAGERLGLLERRYGIGKRWILKIIKS